MTGLALAALIGLAPILESSSPTSCGWPAERASPSTWRRCGRRSNSCRSAADCRRSPSVFPRFQIGVVGGYIDYAHNDYLQVFMEIGLAAPVIVGLLLVAYVQRMSELLRAERGRSFTLLQIGAGSGCCR